MDKATNKQQNQKRGVMETLKGFFSRRQARLHCFYDLIGNGRITTSDYLGSKDIPLAAIIGSMNAGRCEDFDANFKLLKKHSKTRLAGVANAWRNKTLPPVSLVQWGDYYFVQDGHHRLAVANADGHATIRANVTAVTLTDNGSGQALVPANI